MCGIFAYLNYLTEVDRQSIADILTQGLKRLEYRGYDSAGKCASFALMFAWSAMGCVSFRAEDFSGCGGVGPGGSLSSLLAEQQRGHALAEIGPG